MSIVTLLLVGLFAGTAAGLFGIGGGVVIVPALIFLLGFSQHRATGTSLAILLLPVGILGVLEFYRQGNVDIHAAIFIALGVVVGAYLGALIAGRLSSHTLTLCFSLFLIGFGTKLLLQAVQGMLTK